MAEPKPPSLDQLGELLRELAAEDAPAVIESARTRARERAERLIEDRLVKELLAAAAESVKPTRTNRAAGAEHETSGSEAGDAWWTYCIMWDDGAVEVAYGLEGVAAGSSVEAICDGQLAALVSRVPLADYGDEQLRRHLEDLEWVEHTARRHEHVLEAALRETTIVPLRLCTLYRDTDGVRRLLREHRAAFREGLSRVEGCVEWGVKVFADTRVVPTELMSEPAESESRGASYLRRRQNERALAEKAGEVRARCVDVVHQRIAGLSRASTVNPPQRAELHGREHTMLLNGAHLVERNRREELERAVASLLEEWAPLGFTIELTGPWPPYNFVSGPDGVLS